ncbi:MAG TPA: DNA polymerase/3'-5' exonuclease PolX [Gammaproteobacteria bacterium]|nr:DNA polymerase/3'-5' exonuclease PolX [Gammaproteobacteria bacterium]
MSVQNAEIARLLARLADLLEIERQNPFRVRAYRNAARVIGGLSHPVADRVAAGEDLTRLPGIGEDLADRIIGIVKTGRFPLLDEVERRTPGTLSDLMKVPGLGPVRVRTLYRELGITGPEDLERALRTGAVRELRGFGEKTEAALRSALAHTGATPGRTLLAEAEALARPLTEWLAGCDGVLEVAVAGSFRRRRETVGDLDILVTCRRGAPVMDCFTAWEDVGEVVSKGRTRSTVLLRSGMQVDLRVVPQVSYGAALQYFTGSRAHNIHVRRIAGQRELKINEYGVFRGRRRVAGRSEKEVYAALELPWIPPELREDAGEIEAASRGVLPRLIELADLRGDLHCHTRATDGQQGIEEMARAAADHGHEYLAITDHSRRVSMAHGLDPDALLAQVDEIDRIAETLPEIRLLKGIELDILEDGSLDLPDRVLDRLDLAVCAVHYGLGLSRHRQTERILRAMDNPRYTILAHPRGRLIGEREPCDLDMERIMRGARERGVVLEVNAQPRRLDLSDSDCRMACELDLALAIDTDAHSAAQLELLRFGVDQARRGWVEPARVINTLPADDLLARLRR